MKDTFSIIRSRRRTLCLEVVSDARLVIRAPARMPINFIEEFVAKKRSWIEEKQKRALERRAQAREKMFVDGESFLYLGEPHSLSIVEYLDSPLTFTQGFRLSRSAASNGRKVFIDWYIREARRVIQDSLDRHSSLSGLNYNGFRLTGARRSWGSCTPRGSLTFSWRLIMAPLGVIDYVVVHEICHLVHKNHSRRFWDAVSVLLPGYKQKREWLKENGHLLAI